MATPIRERILSDLKNGIVSLSIGLIHKDVAFSKFVEFVKKYEQFALKGDPDAHP